MIEASEKTIAQKTPIKSCVDESAKCSGSNRRDPRSDFSASIPPSTTPSTINDISSLGPHFGSSEPKQPPSGKMRLPSHETRSHLATSLHAARYRDNAEPRHVDILPDTPLAPDPVSVTMPVHSIIPFHLARRR